MKPCVAIIATVPPSGEQGGAERFYEGLKDAIAREGVDAEIVRVVSDEAHFDAIKASYLRFYDLDLSRFDGVVSTKAPGYLVRHPNHVCYLQHTMRVFYDMFEQEFPGAEAELRSQRDLIQKLDTLALSAPHTKQRFVIGEEVRLRLLKFNRLDATVLHQASTMTGYRSGEYEYVFMPGRLHRWKRVDLVVRAMQHVEADVELRIAGGGEDEKAFRELAKGDSRIRFLGKVSDDELLELYSNALVVPFVPIREDFGLVTLEAFHSAKPVITCIDSGEPANIVRHYETGYVVPPDPESVGAAINQLANDRKRAKAMGLAGQASVASINWGHTARSLLNALELGKG